MTTQNICVLHRFFKVLLYNQEPFTESTQTVVKVQYKINAFLKNPTIKGDYSKNRVKA